MFGNNNAYNHHRSIRLHENVNLDTKNIETKLRKPIVLIGMMGTGKTHIGKMLADAMAVAFYDSDKVIEERGGLTINEIFELYGEARFRESEEKTILELLEKDLCVIATGGGAPVNRNVLEAIKRGSVSIWLKSDVDLIYERIKQSKNRPLLQAKDPKAVLEDLLTKREEYYAQADICIEIKENNAGKILSEIIEALANIL